MDSTSLENNLWQNSLTFTDGLGYSYTITGADIASAIGPAVFESGKYDVAVEIAGLNSFTQIVARDDGSPAFEFVPGVDAPAPEPASLALFGVGLLGLSMVTKRRRGA